MKISRQQVIKIMNYVSTNSSFYFPFKIICEDFKKDSDYYEYDCLQDLDDEVIKSNEDLQNFHLEESLQYIDGKTLELMAKEFIDKVEEQEIISKIFDLAVKYRKQWKKHLCESDDIEKYGFNEFVGGKAEAYEDCLELLQKR